MQTEDGSATQFEQNMYIEAVKFYESELSTIEKDESEDPSILQKKVEILVALAETNQTLGEITKALDYFNKAINLNEHITDPEARVGLYWKVGNIYAERSVWDSAMKYYDIALEMSKNSENIGIPEIYRGIGRVKWRNGDFKTAIDFFNKAIKEAEELEDFQLVSDALVDIGNIHSESGNHDEASKYYLNALDILEKNDYIFHMSRIYNNLGDLYLKQGSYDKASDYFQKCIESSEKTGNTRMLGYGLQNAGELKAREGKLDEAMELSTRALEIFNKLDEKYMIALAYMTFGIVHRNHQEWKEAEDNFLRSISILRDINIPFYLGDSYLELGIMYHEKGDNTLARKNIDEAVKMWENVGAAKKIEKARAILEGLP
jgi:tetratricopeptide (TPR) repeat protein